jgi:hypothetical protein
MNNNTLKRFDCKIPEQVGMPQFNCVLPIGGLRVLAQKPTNSMLKNHASEIQPAFPPLNKGGIDCTKR